MSGLGKGSPAMDSDVGALRPLPKPLELLEQTAAAHFVTDRARFEVPVTDHHFGDADPEDTDRQVEGIETQPSGLSFEGMGSDHGHMKNGGLIFRAEFCFIDQGPMREKSSR